MCVLLGMFVPHTLRWWSGGRVTEQQLWLQWVPQILYLAWSLKGFSIWNASGRSLLRLRTSFPWNTCLRGFRPKTLPSTEQFLLQMYGNLGLLALQSSQPQLLHNYSMHLYKPYNYNVWPSLILECICLHKILTKEILFPSFPKVTYDACGRAGKWRSSKSQASSQTTPSFLLRLTTTSSQCGTLTGLFFHAGR